MDIQNVQQTVAAAEQSLWEIFGVFFVVTTIAYIFAYAVTHIGKQFRVDHGLARLVPSSSFLRATVLACGAFMGLWYAAYMVGVLHAYSWKVSLILATITAPIAPLAWNPLAETLAKLRDALIEKVKR